MRQYSTQAKDRRDRAMRKFSLQFRIISILMIILALAMLLQSVIVLYMGLRASIKEDIVWAQQLLIESSIPFYREKESALSAPIGSSYFSNIKRDVFSCVFIEMDGKAAALSSPCHFQKELVEQSHKAKASKNPVTGFADEGWRVCYFGNQSVLLSMPLVDASGEVRGSINAERSLSRIYHLFQKEALLTLCYLLVNLIIFGTIGSLRFSRILFRPLDKLVKRTENYHPDNQSIMPFHDEESAFRRLSISLNALLDRVERDNQRLRNTVEQLAAANRALKEKNELVIRSEKLASTGRLSAGLAHEIGNPLTIIQGYVELLGRQDLSVDEKRKFSANAQKELDRIKALIRQLLDYSRPMHGAKGIVSVNALISEVVSFVSVEKSFAECRIRTDLRAEHDALLIEKDALRQVLVNILFNAVDATAGKSGEREICITSFNDLKKDDSYLAIRVEDNGIGIAKEHLENVFDPFYTTKEPGKGTGLGLFVCHTFVDRMSGQIEIDNRIPEGIEVKILLPIPKVNWQDNLRKQQI